MTAIPFMVQTKIWNLHVTKLRETDSKFPQCRPSVGQRIQIPNSLNGPNEVAITRCSFGPVGVTVKYKSYLVQMSTEKQSLLVNKLVCNFPNGRSQAYVLQMLIRRQATVARQSKQF